MKKNGFKSYLALFILAVAVIAVYKTFDNIGHIFDLIGAFFDILTPFVIAFGIAFLLYPICIMLERTFEKSRVKFLRKHRRGFSVSVVFAIFFAFIATILWFIIPAIGDSVTELKNFFVDDMPQNIRLTVSRLNELGLYIGQPHDVDYWMEFISLENLIENFSLFKVQDIGKYAGRLVSASTAVFDIVMAIIIVVYILLDREDLKNAGRYFLRNTLSKKTRGFILKYVDMTIEFLYRYIYCVLLDALIVFVLSFIVLSVIGVDYALVLALMTGLFNVVPYFGAIIAAIISAVVSFFSGGITTSVIVIVCLVVLQQIDSNLIQPRLIDRSFSIKPFWVIFGVLVGGGLFGMWGILLAIPAMALIKEIIEDYFEWKNKKSPSDKEESTYDCETVQNLNMTDE